MAEAWDEKAVFLAALKLAPADRAAFLRGACPDDAARLRVEALLSHHTGPTSGPIKGVPGGPDLSSLEQIEEFRLMRRVGQGGMGTVYLAHDTVLGRQVALKVLAAHLTESEHALARFREEARSAAVLNHPGIVPVFKLGFDGRVHYIVSEFVDGPTLATVIDEERARRRVSDSTQAVKAWFRRTAEIVLAVADALDCSHRAKIIHRDVKPSNILMDPQRGARLTDFGIAKHLTEEVITRSTGVIGSCHYMSPEQAAITGAKVDQRSDIFSLGVILYELLSLRRPFDGPDIRQVLHAVVAVEPTRLRDVDRRLPKDLETICHTAIEKQPARRYQTAAHLAADLRCYLEGRPILARPPGPVLRGARWAHRHRRVLWPSSAGLLSVSVIALGVMLDQNRRADESRRLQSMGWVSVECETPGCPVHIQPVNARSLEVAPPESLGATPLEGFQRPLGQYRLSVVSSDGASFVEFNLLLINAGERSRTLVHVGENKDIGAGGAAIKTHPVSAARVLSGNFSPTGTVVADMVSVPAGDYVFGWSDVGDAWTGRRTVALPAFYIDRTEVSNREYKEFVDGTGRDPPVFWRDFGYDESLADRPVVNVTLEDAEAYARWRGKRLPTAPEWQGAVRGAQGQLHPWTEDPGDALQRLEPDPADLAQRHGDNLPVLYDMYKRRTVPTRQADPLTSVGQMLNVYGNVEEATASLNLSGREGIAHGRCWTDPARNCTLASIWHYPVATCSFERGFRCAKSAAPPATE